MNKKFLIVFTTCKSRKEARRIVTSLLKKKLIACANIMGPIESRFRWKGRIDKADEVMVYMKTKYGNFASVEKEVKGLHSYAVPEIIAIPVIAGNKDYLKWIESETA
ncbi:MAG: divalent-cation tolerance protein CutA [Candidatus Omnitrophota bacterium]